MKLVLLILLISSFGIYAHKRITIIDISGKFSETEYAEQECEGSHSSKINYILKPDLRVVRVVDGITRIWQSLHVGQDCTYCHVTNHNGRPVLVMLYIQHFNSFHTVKRYRIFHETWVPVTKRLYNEIAKTVTGFEGLEYDLEVDLSQGFDVGKISIYRYTCKKFTNVRLNPNFGYHIDIVRHGDTVLWKRTKYQEEIVEINMIVENGRLTHAHLVYETYYNTLDHYYFRYENEWTKISKKYYYHKNERPNSLIPYEFPDEVIDLSSNEESQEELPVCEQPFDTSIIGARGKIFDTKRPVPFRRFPRPMVRQDYNTPKQKESDGDDNQQKDVSLERDIIVVLDDNDDDDESVGSDPSVIELNEQSEYTTTQPTTSQEIPHITLETGSSEQISTYETPTFIELEHSLSQQKQPQQHKFIQQQQQQYISDVQHPSTGSQTQIVDQVHQYGKHTSDVQKASTSSQIHSEQRGYIWYGQDDGSSSGEQQVYTWYGCEQPSTTSQTVPQYSYSYAQTSSTSQTQTQIQDKDNSEKQISTSSQSQYEPIVWYQVESGNESYQTYQSASSYYTYEPVTSGESLKDSIYPYQEPYKETAKDQTSYDSSKKQTTRDKSDKIPTQRVRRKSNEASKKGTEWLWYKRPQTKTTDQPPPKKQILSYNKNKNKNKEITISAPDLISTPDDLSLDEVPNEYSNLIGKNDNQLEKELTFFESYYMDFEEEDACSKRHQKRRGDRGYYFEKISDVEVRGKTGIDIDLFELDDANPDYTIEVQSYYSVPVFKIIPAANKFFKEVNADQLIVWKNQDRGLCLVLKAVMINGEFGLIEAIVKRYSNKCYLHYKYERGYYRSVHTPTYLNTISSYALELHEEAMSVAKEQAEMIAKRQKEAALKAGIDEKEIAVREFVRRKGDVNKDLRAKGRPRRKYAERKPSEDVVIEVEPLCLSSLRRERGKKRKKEVEKSEPEYDDDDYDVED